VAAQVGLRDPCIPLNMVGHRSFDLGVVDHTRVSVTATRVAVALSWGEPKTATAGSTPGSINKVRVSGFLWSLAALLSHLAGRGGEEMWRCGEAVCNFGGSHGVRGTAHFWRSSSVAHVWLPTQGAGGQQLQALMSSLRQEIINLHRRPFEGLAAAHHFPTVPSDHVPGAGGEGCRLRPKLVGGCRGPDCISLFQYRVCSIIDKGLFQIVLLLEVLSIICTALLQY
jgi:hypothetical protein